MPSASIRGEEPVLSILLDEVLDAEAVRRARLRLERAPPHAAIEVDFHRVRHVEWFALASLMQELSGLPARRVELRGVCDHHLRVLRYLDGCGRSFERVASAETMPLVAPEARAGQALAT